MVKNNKKRGKQDKICILYQPLLEYTVITKGCFCKIKERECNLYFNVIERPSSGSVDNKGTEGVVGIDHSHCP